MQHRKLSHCILNNIIGISINIVVIDSVPPEDHGSYAAGQGDPLLRFREEHFKTHGKL